jgi:hypothetical protein
MSGDHYFENAPDLRERELGVKNIAHTVNEDAHWLFPT